MTAPDTLGHFTVLAPLGAGGMGTVYRAHDPRLGRDVAIKLLHTDQGDEAARERFRREARAASALSHPNIITVFDVGEAPSGWFIAMELVVGESIADWRQHPPPVERLIDAIGQCALALATAHEAGIVHRDVKPENVMIRRDGCVKLLDFGLARLTDGEHRAEGAPARATAAGLTIPGLVIGTLRYLSPEQAAGELVGPSSDVFSLGSMLYELATGQHPFAAPTEIAVLGQIITRDPPPASSVAAHLPDGMDALLAAMLDKEPGARPSAMQVAETLYALAPTPVRPGALRPRSIGTGPTDPDPGSLSTDSGGSAATATPERTSDAVAHPTAGLRRIRARRSGVVVGHAAEAATLLAHWRHVVQGTGQMIGIAGEAGIGKTTFVEDALAALQTDGTVVIARGRCSERLAGTEAYLPVLDALDGACEADASGRTATMIAELAPAWHALRTHDAGAALGTQERLKREMVALLRQMTESQPLVLFLDDMHWADASTVDLLGYLGAHLEGIRVLLLTTYRGAEMQAAQHPFVTVTRDLRARDAFTEIAVSLLQLQEVQHFLDASFPGHAFPPELAARLQARTEGNALFLVDVVRWMGAQGLIAETDGQWRLQGALDALERGLPSSVRAMIERKIAQLDETDRRLLQAAAVQGAEFDSAALAIALRTDEADLEDRLLLLDRVYAFVRRRGEERYPDRSVSTRYRFVHVLYQNVLMEEVTPSRRASWARAIADELERRAREQVVEQAAELALLREAARDPDAAATWYGVAASRALSRYAYVESAELAARGMAQLALLDDGPARDRAELTLRLVLGTGSLVRQGYQAPETSEHMERAQQLSTQVGDAPALLPALYVLLLRAVAHGSWEEAEAVLTQATAAATGAHEELFHTARTLWSVGTYVHHGDAPSGYRFALEADAMLEAGRHHALPPGMHPDPVLTSLSEAVRAGWMMGDDAFAWRQLDKAKAYARDRKDPQSEPFLTIFECELHMLQGDAAAAVAAAQRGLAIATEHGIASEQLWNMMYLGGALTTIGKAEDALALLRQGMAIIEAVGLWVCILQFSSYLASALRQTGDLAGAASELARAMTIAERRDYLDFVPFVWIEAARLLAHPDWSGEAVLGVQTSQEALARAHAFVDRHGAIGYRRLIDQAFPA